MPERFENGYALLIGVDENRVAEWALPGVGSISRQTHLSLARIRGTALVVRTSVRFYGDESPTTNPPSTDFGQTQLIWRLLAARYRARCG